MSHPWRHNVAIMIPFLNEGVCVCSSQFYILLGFMSQRVVVQYCGCWPFSELTIITAARSSKKFSAQFFFDFAKVANFCWKTQVLHHIKTGFFQVFLKFFWQGLAIKKSLEITMRKNSEPWNIYIYIYIGHYYSGIVIQAEGSMIFFPTIFFFSFWGPKNWEVFGKYWISSVNFTNLGYQNTEG